MIDLLAIRISILVASRYYCQAHSKHSLATVMTFNCDYCAATTVVACPKLAALLLRLGKTWSGPPPPEERIGP